MDKAFYTDYSHYYQQLMIYFYKLKTYGFSPDYEEYQFLIKIPQLEKGVPYVFLYTKTLFKLIKLFKITERSK
jgi:hypothetical protein